MTNYNDFYTGEEYLRHNPTWHVEDSEFKAEKIINIISKNNINFKSIVEVGCGVGEIVKILSDKYKDIQIAGFDISKPAIDIAKNKESDNLKFFNEDILLTDKHFDVLILADVFEHVKDYLGFIENLSTHSDYMIFHIPLDISIQKIFFPKRIIRNRKEVGHLHYFIKETALETIKDCGLEIIDYSYTRWGLEMKQKGLVKKIGKIPLFILDLISTDFASKVLGGNSLIVLAKVN